MWTDDFFELFYSNDTKNIKKAHELKNKNIPNFLYKYKSIDDKGYTFDLLENDLIYLSNVNNLNDLYEGELFFDVQNVFHKNLEPNIITTFLERSKMSIEEKERILNSNNPYLEIMEYIYETEPTINKDIPFEEFNEFNTKMILDILNGIYDDFNNHSKKTVYLTCFSENHDIILMWSYYSDSNKGICIKYNSKDFKNFIIHSCFPIKYEDGYEYTDELSNMEENTFKLLFDPFLRKETVWSHEKEWRILFNKELLLRSAIKIGEKYFLKLPKPSAIYLGKRITTENKRKIFDICKKREISLYQMEKDSRNAKIYENVILKYSEKNWEDELFIVESIKNKACKSLINNYFNYSRSIGDIKKGFSRIIDSFKNLTNNEIQFFIDELLFKNNISPVLYPYYNNVLLFLIQLLDNNSFNDIKTSDGLTIEKNIETWIGYCISSFYNKKIVRYLIYFERLFMRFYNRYIILNHEEQQIIERELFKYKFNNNYVTLIKDDIYDEVKLMHPFTNIDQTELINNNIKDNLQTVINLFYINGQFDEESCYEEYQKLKSSVERIEKNSQTRYNEIFSNSKELIPIHYDTLLNKNYDFQLNGTGAVLNMNKEILKLINPKDKKMLENLGKINNNYKISNSILNCCDELNIEYKEKIRININDYFNPKNNPYILN